MTCFSNQILFSWDRPWCSIFTPLYLYVLHNSCPSRSHVKLDVLRHEWKLLPTARIIIVCEKRGRCVSTKGLISTWPWREIFNGLQTLAFNILLPIFHPASPLFLSTSVSSLTVLRRKPIFWKSIDLSKLMMTSLLIYLEG